MNVVVFSGPSLAPNEARSILPIAQCYGPAAQGDILRAVTRGAQVVCLIDGVFEQRPPVAHKEILWAIDRGVQVYGASSMGALRAVELAPFGMHGFGQVFEDLYAGRFEDDDEVTVSHGGPETDYRAGSDAMVNIRATLARAESLGVIASTTQLSLEDFAKSRFYPLRQLRQLVRELQNASRSAELNRLADWLSIRSNWVDVKRRDAEGLLLHVGNCAAAGPQGQAEHTWCFPSTTAWDALLREHTRSELDLRGILEELQLTGLDTFTNVLLAASWRAVAISLHEAELNQALSPPANVPTVGEQDALVERLSLPVYDAILEQVPHVLRVQGDLERVAERARIKRLALAEQAVPEEQAVALTWYFESRLRCAVPNDLDAYARKLGLASTHHLYKMIARERAFVISATARKT